MRIYRQSFTLDGKKRMAQKWYLDFYFKGERHRLPGLTDKRTTESFAGKIQELCSLRSAGQTPGAELQRWIDNLPEKILLRLVEWRIIDAIRVATGKLLSDHIDDFEKSLKAKGFVGRHIQQVIGRIRAIFGDCKFRTYTEITYSRVESILADLRKDRVVTDGAGNKTTQKGLSAKTSNDYVQAVRQFCKWMVKDRRASINPLEHLEKQGTQNDRRLIRRALTVGEIGYLLHYLETQAGVRYGLSGKERALIYKLALMTGLRKGEIDALTVDCIDFESKTLTLQGAYTKNRNTAVLPLRDDILGDLRDHCAGKLPTTRLFKIPDKGAKMVGLDLKDAKEHWVKQAEKNKSEAERRKKDGFLERSTEDGQIDFHSLRHTFGTMLAKSGIHPKTAQSLMRHSTITLTMDRYTHTCRESEKRAVDVLPDFSKSTPDIQIATGTDDMVVDVVPAVCIENNEDKKSLPYSLPCESSLEENSLDYAGLVESTQNALKTALEGSKTAFLNQGVNCACRDSNPKPSVPKTDALSN